MQVVSTMSISVDGVWVCAVPEAVGMVDWIEAPTQNKKELYLFLPSKPRLQCYETLDKDLLTYLAEPKGVGF